MNDKPFNNNFFTEENSPVPLIPPDQAWEAMQVKLDNPPPGQKRRRTLLWLPPVGCVLVLLLLLGGGYGIWMYTTLQPSKGYTDQPAEQLTTPLATKSKEPQSQGAATNDPASQEQPIALSHKDTSSLTRNTVTEEKALLTSKTTHPIQSAQRGNSGMRSIRLHQKPKLPELTTVAPLAAASAVPANFLRPSTVAGVHYPASIWVVPYKAPRPAWLPEDHSTNGSSGNQPARKVVWAAGLQVEVPVPISGVDVYFKNPDAKDRFLQPLIPGIWGSVRKNRHRITTEFKPFANALLPDRPFSSARTVLPDSSIVSSRTMVKVFGMQFGLHYAYEIRPDWWLGAGLTGSIWKKALIHGDSLGSFSVLYGVHHSEEPRLRTFQPGVSIQVSYRKNAWEGMLQVESPFNATARGGPHPVWARLGLRLRLLQSKNGPVGGPLDQVRCP